MSNFSILDLVIGMVFIYFLLSVVCSSVVELWFTLLRTRARLLEEWLKQVFDKLALDPQGLPLNDKKGQQVTVGQAIMDHCMVTALSGSGKSTDYISANNFFAALMDKITLSPAPAGGAVPVVQPPPASLTGYIAAIGASQLYPAI